MTFTSTIRSLDPTQFENLVYDLVVRLGLQNVFWRTPGPDGGRDIEGKTQVVDFSGSLVEQTWYIECKKYAKAIDWPTVFEKVSYALNHRADCLLLVTTSHASPACQNEIMRWNNDENFLVIRVWSVADIENLLSRFPELEWKYNLRTKKNSTPPRFLNLGNLLSKSIQTAYNTAVFQNIEIYSLEASAAVAELLTSKLGQFENDSNFHRTPYDAVKDSYPWLPSLSQENLAAFDKYGLRAFLAVFRFLTNGNVSVELVRRGILNLTANAENFDTKQLELARYIFSEISFWSDCEFQINGAVLTLKARL